MTEFVDRNDAGNIDFAERIADLEAAPPAPESFDATAALQRVMAVVEDLESYVGARGNPQTGSYDDGLNRAQASAAADLRAALGQP